LNCYIGTIVFFAFASASLSSESVLITTPAASNTDRSLGDPVGDYALGMIPPAAGFPSLLSLLLYSFYSILLISASCSSSLSIISLSNLISSYCCFLFISSLIISS
jgi:hypothetical protein